MKPRQSRLLQILKEADGDYVYGNYLSEQLEVSLRTVRNDVKEVNEIVLQNALIESNNRFGYRLIGTLEEIKTYPYQNFQERAFFIVKTLLEAKNYTVYANLADQIYYSARTIRFDVQKLSRLCARDFQGLEIQAKPFHGVQLIGEEVEKRALLEEVIQKENHSEREILHNAFLMFREWYSKKELEQILDSIKISLRNSSLTISLRVLDQMFIHLLIKIRRVKKKSFVNVDSTGNSPLPLQEKEMSMQILENVGQNFNLTFPKEEISYFAVFLISKKVCNRETHINQHRKEDNQNMMSAMTQALSKIEKQFGHPLLTDDQLLMGLYYHVERSIYPLKYSMKIDNPFIEKIKKKYLQSYYMGVFFAQEIERTICVSIDENEIGFIALHIQAALERIDKKTHVMEIAIVCSSGVATSSLLKQKIEKSLPEIKVNGIYSTHTMEQIPTDVNLIVSTVPINIKQKKVLLVEEFLEEKDLNLIKKTMYLNLFTKMMGKERFAIFDADNKEELISQALTHFGLDPYENSILEREAISSTDVVNGVALPHPLSEYLQETAIYVVINKRSISWGKNKVQLVLFLFLNEEDRVNYDQLFRELYYLVTAEEKLSEIYEVSSYEQYIKILK